MQKLVISSSAKVFNELQEFMSEIKGKYEILDHVHLLNRENYEEDYKKRHVEFYKNLLSADVYLLFNPDQKNTIGYIGSASFAELNFAVCQNFLNGMKKEIYIFKMPDKSVGCYDEIKLWLDLKWIKIWGNRER